MHLLDHWSIPWGYLLTFAFGCWYGASWVHRHNVVMDRSRHRRLVNDLNDTTNALARVTAGEPSFVTAPKVDDDDSFVEFIDVYVEEES